jgi:hypothetical protein
METFKKPKEFVNILHSTLGLPMKWLKDAVREGTIPHLKIGNSWFINEEQVKEVLLDVAKSNCKPTKLDNPTTPG